MDWYAIERTLEKYLDDPESRYLVGNRILTTYLLQELVCQDKEIPPKRFNPISHEELSKLHWYHVKEYEKKRYRKKSVEEAIKEFGGAEIISTEIIGHPCPELIIELLEKDIHHYTPYITLKRRNIYYPYIYELDKLGNYELEGNILRIFFDTYFGVYFVHNVIAMNVKILPNNNNNKNNRMTNEYEE